MGFAAAPLAILIGVLLTGAVVLVLYWVRPEPQPITVPSNLIWRRVLDERRRREDFWRWLISLLVALLASLAVVLALSEPAPAGAGAGGRVVLVLDTSPTMAAAAGGGTTRWDRAADHARGILESAGPGTEFLILDTAGQRGGRSFDDRRAGLEAVAALGPVFDAEHALPDLADLLDSEAATEVVLIGDGVRIPEVPDGARTISVFEPVDNAGITAFDVRPLPTDPGRFEAFVEVVRHTASPDASVLVLQIDGAAGASVRRTLRVEPGVPRGETVPLAGFVSGPVRAVIAGAGADGLAADDVAHAYVPSRNRLRVLLTGEESPYWEAALRLDPRVSLTRAPEGADPFADFDPGAFDLVVIEGDPPPEAPPRPVLIAGSGSADWLPPRLGGTTEAAVTLPMRSGREPHPALSGVDFGDALAREVDAFDPAAEADPGRGGWRILAGDARLGLLAAREQPLRVLAFAFPLARSNLALQPDFPVFLSRALSWLTDVEVRRSGLGAVRVTIAEGGVFDAEGREVPSRRIGSDLSFQADLPSLYYVAGGGREVVVAASLLDRAASDLNRSAWAGEPSAAAPPGSPPVATLWPILALFALVLLVVEWVAFHRHVTV